MKLRHFTALLFSVFLLSANCAGVGELKENVLKSYKDDIALLKQYRFPYPFLAEIIRKDNLHKRSDIQKVIRAYESHEVVREPHLNATIDRYAYDLGFYGKAYVEIWYDNSNQLLRIDESGSSIMILE